MLTTLIAFLIVLGILIFIHELGHFLAARHVGVRVEAFSVGFPPTLWGKKIRDTEFYGSTSGHPSRRFSGGQKNWYEKIKRFVGCKQFEDFDDESIGLAKNFHPRYWEFIRTIFQITAFDMYDKGLKDLDQAILQRMETSEISSIRKRISEILLQEQFLKFKNLGGVIR